jgi:ribosome-associated toxin RatA of RatAB toxin-antitoxin module
MKHVKKTVLLWYSAQEMYDLVVDVPNYPKFLPWCERAEVLHEDASSMTARLHLAYRGVRHAFTTRNTHVTGRSVVVTLVDGPFSTLDGTWEFLPVGSPAAAPTTATPSLAPAPPAPPSPDALRACRIQFDLRYAFSNIALEALVSPVFDRIANTFVDAFVQRAEQVYGAR